MGWKNINPNPFQFKNQNKFQYTNLRIGLVGLDWIDFLWLMNWMHTFIFTYTMNYTMILVHQRAETVITKLGLLGFLELWTQQRCDKLDTYAIYFIISHVEQIHNRYREHRICQKNYRKHTILWKFIGIKHALPSHPTI